MKRTELLIFTVSFIILVGLTFTIFSSLRNKITAATTFTIESIGCDVACHGNIDCNDNNSCTKDACMFPGDCSARCIHSPIEDCS